MSEEPLLIQPDVISQSPDATKTHSSEQIDADLDTHRHKTPGRDGFVTSIRGYCDKAIDLSLEKYRYILDREPGNVANEVAEKLTDIRSRWVAMKEASEKKWLATQIERAVIPKNPSLGVDRYTTGLQVPTPSERRQLTLPRFPGFEQRINDFMEWSLIDVSDPKVQIIAAGFLTQVAKNYAVLGSKRLMERAHSVSRLGSDFSPQNWIATIQSQVDEIRQDERYLALGTQTMNQIAKEAGLEEEQIDLLLDVAFIKDPNERPDPKVIESFLLPLSKLIAEGNWEEAFVHRDFLMKYFSDFFPEWKVREASKQSGALKYRNFSDIGRAALSEGVAIDPAEIPDGYKQAFEGILGQKIQTTESREIREIMQQSLKLSEYWMIEMSDAIKVKLWTNHLLKLEAKNQYSDLPRKWIGSKSRNERYDTNAYREWRLAVGGDSSDEVINKEIELISHLQTMDIGFLHISYPQIPRATFGEDFPFRHEKGKHYYLTEAITMGRGYKKNFGNLVSRVCLGSFEEESPYLLKEEEIIFSLRRAHELYLKESKSDISLAAYVSAILESNTSAPHILNDERVRRLIKSIEQSS